MRLTSNEQGAPPQSTDNGDPVPQSQLPSSRLAPVLVVDDDSIGRRVLARYLTFNRFIVHEAEDAANAFEVLSRLRPGAIVMDIQLPNMDGITAIRKIRATPNGRTIPIIALTALAMPGDQARCIAAGASWYLSKPIRLRTIAAVLGDLLDHGRLPASGIDEGPYS